MAEKKRMDPWLILAGAFLVIAGLCVVFLLQSSRDAKTQEVRQTSASIPVSPPHNPPTVWPADAGATP